MLTKEHLLAAVERQIISREQALELARLAADQPVDSEEQVVFARGFNDIFVAIGAVLIVVASFWAATLTGNLIVGPILCAAIFWAMTEFLVTGRGMLAPGRVFCVAFALSTGMLLAALFGEPLRSFSNIASHLGWLFAVGALAGAGGFFIRFRMPFALFLIGALVPLSLYLLLVAVSPGLAGPWTQRTVALIGGIGAFAVAMGYDFADRERKGRASQCAFWLHLIAAPLLVHTVLGSMIGGYRTFGGGTALAILAITVVVALVALAIDRRAMLIASLIYAGIAIGYAISQAGVSAAYIGLVTIAILGGAVTLLGAGWLPMRARLLVFLPHGLVARLPKIAQ